MIYIDPGNIGCGRKLPWARLQMHMDVARSILGERYSVGDSATVALMSNVISGSIDRVVKFTDEQDTFAIAAINHAINDIIAAGSLPESLSISFGFSEMDVERGGDLGIIAEFFRYALSIGVAVGKLHSFLDTVTSATISVIGRKWVGEQVDGSCGGIYLTKPIGALKSTYLGNLGFEGIDFSETRRCITTSSIEYASLVRSYAVGCSDVSGFGLYHALDNLLSQLGARGTLNIDAVPALNAMVWSHDVACLTSDAGAEHDAFSIVGNRNASVGLLSELNGPLLLLAPRECETVLSANWRGKWPLIEVGQWERLQI